ncbi:MAG TPA: hypothetical protein VFP94_04640, partial [Terriglobales bacterium]|nr:hypothetical protein [Terriglobales bacterium]
DILNHNTETVPELYRFVRPGAKFARSLELLRRVKELAPGMLSKTGLMLGLGESEAQLLAALRQLAATGCDILTLGQYLRPTRNHLPVKKLYTPAEFAALREQALGMGFGHVEAGPLVRSSYHAHSQAENVHSRPIPAARRRPEQSGHPLPGSEATALSDRRQRPESGVEYPLPA